MTSSRMLYKSYTCHCYMSLLDDLGGSCVKTEMIGTSFPTLGLGQKEVVFDVEL